MRKRYPGNLKERVAIAAIKSRTLNFREIGQNDPFSAIQILV
jgi:hypothetical protein